MQRFEQVKQTEDTYVMHTYARFDVALESGRGATAVDVEGKSYVDFGSGIGVNSLGYADPGWAAAVAAQAGKLAHLSNLYYSPVTAETAKALCEASGFSRAFFCNSGAEANEGLVKLARKYSFDRYGKGRAVILTLENSFHGRTVTTLSATGQDAFHNYFFPFTEGFRFVKANDAGAMERAMTGDVCAVLLEAVQGEGGVVPLDAEFVRKTAALAHEKDILLLFDEVQTGIGRTGKFFAYEHFGVAPDAVSCAKGLAGGLPIGAALCGEKLKDVLGPGTHGTTFGGNPLSCAGAGEVLRRVAAPGFLGGVTEKGEFIRARLAVMPHVRNVRGLGLMLAFDIEGTDSKTAAAALAAQGLLILTAKSSLRMLPPLVITQDELMRGLTILETYLRSL